MPSHTKAERSKKKRGNPLVKKIKQAVANEKLRIRVESARSQKIRTERGQDTIKKFGPKHPINRATTPGIRARVRNLARTGEAVPTFTKGKLDKGGPVKRAAVAFQKFKNRQSAKATAKDRAANKRKR